MSTQSVPVLRITVVIVDELVAKPGRAAEVLARYDDEYVPRARARGMRLVHQWVSPPTFLADGVNSLMIVWEVEGPDGWWQARAGGRDPEVLDFWQRLAPLIESRVRRHCAAPGDLSRLEDVSR